MSRSKITLVLTIATVTIVATLAAPTGRKIEAKAFAPTAFPTPEKTLFSEYRGVKIGMPLADVRVKIGTTKDKTQSDAQDQYIFSDYESVQFYYDASKN